MSNELITDFDKYVHITNQTKAGLIEFDFSVGDPTMYLELALPVRQFENFCNKNGVKYLTKQQEIDVENDRHKWKYGEVGTLKYEKEQE
ncbi:phenol hydroxylase subunit [Arcobacter sp. LA11]|uniref:phenol hydroxylase subunit n=1 Tax=Arcobacter sp. LA11 TaxID=1898176 RepID=UPI0009323592|nr:phenol hydroxylase subunit [Arcobacter sp. LA11]